MFFQGLRDVLYAFSSEAKTGDHEVDEAVGLIVDLRAAGSSVGFFGRDPDQRPTSVAIKLLRDHGKNLDYEQTIKFVEALQRLDENQSIRRRFWVQLFVTIVVLGIALSAILGLLHVSDDLTKVAYGFVGTVIGYWLK